MRTPANTATPPTGLGPLRRREARLAWVMLAPTMLIVALIVMLPLLANFWISIKPVALADLRPPAPMGRERLRGEVAAPGDEVTVEYRLRNSSTSKMVRDVTLTDTLPAGLEPRELDARCTLEGRVLACALGDWPGGHRERLRIPLVATADFVAAPVSPRESEPALAGSSDNVLTSSTFTLGNFRKVFDATEFWTVLRVSLYYTVFGTGGALLLGLFAAQLLHQPFRGRALLRGLLLFPYVAPVIAVAFTWVVLLDPFSGALNALLERGGATAGPINFFGQRVATFSVFGIEIEFPLALTTVIAFEAWRYFPLSFLFILARMQSINTDMYEAAEMDGASPFQQFRWISLPQLAGILSILFLLRFIWTFNKFDDIFLLTGGGAGTRTLTVDVYEQAFALSNLGAGAAVAVVVFAVLLLFSIFYFRFLGKEDGM